MPSRARGEVEAVPGRAVLPARQQELKVVVCALLAFGDRPALEDEFQRAHAAPRLPYDVIRAVLRLVAWLALAAKAAAAGRACAWLAWLMAMAGVIHSLAPVALLVASPDAFLRWRSACVAAWNVSHAIMSCAFYPQLHNLSPSPPSSASASLASAPTSADVAAAATAASIAAASAGNGLSALGLSALPQLAFVLWHSQAAVMALNGGSPLEPIFMHLLNSQLMIFLLYLHRNPQHCAAHPQMRSAVAAVHARLLRPMLHRLFRHLPAPLASSAGNRLLAASDAVQLCALYLPLLQLFLGLVLPCALVYRRESRQRAAFLAQRGLRPAPVLLHRELGLALLAAALQLGAVLSLWQG